MLLTVLVVPSAQSGDRSSFLHNDWETNDWLSLGIVLPAPSEHCEEENNQPPCYRVTSVPIIVRIEVGRFRSKTYQWNIASGSVGLDWTGREHIRVGFAGFGMHWRTSNPNQEVGFLLQPLSIFMGPQSFGNSNTNLYFRHNYKTHFWEVGVDFSVYWVTSPLGNSTPWGGGIEGFPIYAYFSVGI